MRRLVVLPVLLALGVLCGCGLPVADQPAGGFGGGSAGGPPDPRAVQARLDEQARQALARWDEAAAGHGGGPRFVLVDDGSGVVGEAEPEIAGNFKWAVVTGQLEAAPGVLPAGHPGTGEVRWSDGQTATLPLRSAEVTLQAMKGRARGDCGGCTPLQVTGARLVTVTVRTDRGGAAAPAWEYTLAGTAARITQVAVAASAAIAVTPPPWDPMNTPSGPRAESATVAADGRTVTVHFAGARDGTGPCTADYTARAVESEHAAVIIIEEHRHPVEAGTVCTLDGPRTATVILAAPLAQRTLLEVVQGTPIPTDR